MCGSCEVRSTITGRPAGKIAAWAHIQTCRSCQQRKGPTPTKPEDEFGVTSCDACCDVYSSYTDKRPFHLVV